MKSLSEHDTVIEAFGKWELLNAAGDDSKSSDATTSSPFSVVMVKLTEPLNLLLSFLDSAPSESTEDMAENISRAEDMSVNEIEVCSK